MFISRIYNSIRNFLYAGRRHRYQPPEGFVPDEKAAIRIAQAVWEPIYGADHISREKPFSAKLQNGIWLVEGSLPKPMPGGVALAEIDKKTGRIIRVSHGQ